MNAKTNIMRTQTRTMPKRDNHPGIRNMAWNQSLRNKPQITCLCSLKILTPLED